jgi:nucleoside phosphorylase
MVTFSTKKRIGVDGTEAWVISINHINEVLDLVFQNRFGEIWLFNNDLTFFEKPNLFRSVYIHKIVGELGNRINKIKVFVEDAKEDDVLENKCEWLQKRFRELSDFINERELKEFPQFLFARMSTLKKHSNFTHLFGDEGIPPHHTWVFYLHGESLHWDRQHGIALFRPTEFPFANRDNPLALSWHLSDDLILTSSHRDAFDFCFSRHDFFEELFPGHEQQKSIRHSTKNKVAKSEGLAFGEPADVLILSPADDEMAYMRKRLGELLHEMTMPARTIRTYCFVTQNKRSVILAKIGEGNIAASVATTRLLDIFRPKQVILLGVAGAIVPRGRHNWVIGDVVIGQSVIGYEWGKVIEPKTEDSWRFVPKSDITTTWGGEQHDRLLYQKACEIAMDGWRLTREEIKAHMSRMVNKRELPKLEDLVDKVIKHTLTAHPGTIGSGSKVIASRKYVKQVVDKKSEDINAFETEASGVAYACQHAEWKIDFLTIRGIMDLADGKTRDRKIRNGLRYIAKIACGNFVEHLLGEL